MSVLCQTSHGWFIDHWAMVSQVYNIAEQDKSGLGKDAESGTPHKHYSLKSEMFDIQCPFMMDSHFENWKKHVNMVKDEIHRQTSHTTTFKRKKKRKLEIEENSSLSQLHERLQASYTELLDVARASGYLTKMTDIPENNNVKARHASNIEGPGDKLVEDAGSMSKADYPWSSTPYQVLCKQEVLKMANAFHRLVTYKGDNPALVNLEGDTYILPPKTTFVMSDFHQLQSQVNTMQVSGGYDLIVVDPPWQNKSVKRKKSYNTLHEEDLLQLPLPDLAAPGCLLVLWVTNNPRLVDFVLQHLFPAWGVRSVRQWHWIKVTVSGSLICDMDSPTKKPYETILLGQIEKKCGNSTSPGRDNSDLPDDHILLSVPCSLHSKKPPLMEVLSKYLPPDPQCLELFARNLWPGWVSWGQEVLKHQHIDYYEDIKSCDNFKLSSDNATVIQYPDAIT